MIFHIKYVPFIIIGATFLFVAYKILTTHYLLKWFIRTLEENGKPSGKALAAFGCINSIIIAFYVSMYYGDKHVPPEWFVWLMASLAASFYGIREVGRYIDTKFGGNAPPTSAIESMVPQAASNVPAAKKTEKVTPTDNGNQAIPKEEIG